MRKYCITIILVLICLLELRLVLKANELPAPLFNVIFSEVLVGSQNSGSEEFIELYNLSGSTVNLTNWRIEYFSVASVDATKPTRTINLSGEIPPDSYFLVSSSAYTTELESLKYTATLSQTGGSIRLTNLNEGSYLLEDALGWGEGKMGLGDPALAPSAGQALIRNLSEEEVYEPGLNNIDDFTTSTELTPLSPNELPPEPEVILPSDPISEEPIPETGNTEPKVYLAVEVSEILPNPAEPDSDADSEFVELFNPHSVPVDIGGYVLKAGLNGTYKHTFSAGTFVEPNSYIVVTSANSSLTLSNTAGKVLLYDPEGTMLSESATYSEAPAGQAYILVDGAWQWTVAITPALANNYVAPPPPIVKSSAKKKTASKAKKAKATKKAVVKTKTSTAKNNDPGAGAIREVSGPVHPLVLAGLGVLTVAYAGYEYRYDVKNLIQKLRRNRVYRRTTLKTP